MVETRNIIRKTAIISVVIVIVIAAVFSVYSIAYAERIFPGVYVGSLDFGGLTNAEAKMRLNLYEQELNRNGIRLKIDDEQVVIQIEDIDFSLDIEKTVNSAWEIGRRGSMRDKLAERIGAPFSYTYLSSDFFVDEDLLEQEVAVIAELRDVSRKDVRLFIEGADVSVLYDTEVGSLLNRSESKKTILSTLRNVKPGEILLSREDDLPRVDADNLGDAEVAAARILVSPLNLKYRGRIFPISREEIGSWIISEYLDNALLPALDERAISVFVTGIAGKINTAPQNIRVNVVDGKVVDFVAPRAGEVLEEESTILLVMDALLARRDAIAETEEIALPVITRKPIIDETAEALGIVELIGTATTPFTGSPKNRVHNIENGTQFLSGILIKPGEEFSTTGTLGRIDNTTGYLQELVIKGNRTIPEYGGGLCQVSTTLFRAILDAGLPVTMRRAHSYRVPYYEYDGDGNFIGPGLDATIYSPRPDLRFVNDTSATIMIQGRVEGDKLTFDLYGTKDGRVSEIDGPYTLTTLPPGDPIYADTDTLAKGVVKRIESAHSGGAAVATYKVTYESGEVKEQVFKSNYRRWPARYLVGTRE